MRPPSFVTPAVLAVAAMLVSCDAARPPDCPGDRVATFQFSGELATGDTTSCPFASQAPLAFTATLSFVGDGEALLCIDRTDAPALAGTRLGDHVVVTTPATLANVSQCTCAVQVVETLEGDVARADGQPTGFAGELRDDFTVQPTDSGPPATCEPTAPPGGGLACGVPCSILWTVTATR